MDEAPSQVIMKRQTAYKVWTKDIHSAQTQIDPTSGFPIFLLSGKAFVRVNIIGSIIDSFTSGNYGSFVLDDGSAQVRLKVWADDLYLLDGKGIGDLVLVVGRVAEFNGERYVRPEIIRSISQDWALFRRLELVKLYGEAKREVTVVMEREEVSVPEVEPSLVAREMILSTIEKQEEISDEALFQACALPKDKVATALYDLLKEGEIFSPKKGYYRLV